MLNEIHPFRHWSIEAEAMSDFLSRNTYETAGTKIEYIASAPINKDWRLNFAHTPQNLTVSFREFL
ncbi:MAG: hypothetical protein CMK92_05460, partial [Pseudomonas sp.]|nr:hypothetical protein [Pseudomonas sp.]